MHYHHKYLSDTHDCCFSLVHRYSCSRTIFRMRVKMVFYWESMGTRLSCFAYWKSKKMNCYNIIILDEDKNEKVYIDTFLESK